MAKAGDKKIVIIMIILFVIALGILGALCYYKWIKNNNLKKRIAEVNKNIDVEEERKARIDGLVSKKREVVEAINSLTEILPTEAETEHSEFLRLLRKFASQAGVIVNSLSVPAAVENPELRIKQYKYSILVEGTFSEFVLFLNQIETHKRFLKVDSFNMSNESTAANYWPT